MNPWHRLVLYALLATIAIPAEAQQFKVAGIDHDSAVFSFLARLRCALVRNDSGGVVATFTYPLRVGGGAGQERIEGPEPALRRYSAIVTPSVRDAILAQHPDSLFANWQGIMIGNGQVWLKNVCQAGVCDSVRIFSINRGARAVE